MSRLKEAPIFGKQKVNFVPSFALTHLCVSNNRVVLAMQNKTLLRIDLSNPEMPEEIDLKAHTTDAKLSSMYLDPSGQHLMLAFSPRDSENPAEVMYLSPQSTKPKEIPRLRSHIITSVGWSPNIELTNLNATNPFLLGTSKGLLFEADIANGEVKVSKQLYDIGKGNAAVISGLEYFFLPRTNKCFILVATSKKLYQFKGFVQNKDDRPWFSNIFNTYLSQSGIEDVLEFGEVAPYVVSDQAISRLSVLYDTGTGYPRHIGYLSDTNSLIYKDVVSASSSFTLDNFLKDTKTIRCPGFTNAEGSPTKDSKSPRSLIMTDYHVLVLYNDCIRGICTLNEEIIFEDVFETSRDRVINIARDPVKGSIWFFTERAVQKYSVRHEDRNIWKIYLDKEDFVRAQETVKGDAEKMEQISMRQAEYFFRKKEYEKSAMYYALTSSSFEEIALKFVQIDDTLALKTFLLKKLSSLQPHEMTKVAVLVLWIIELYLNEMGSLRDFGKKETPEYRVMESEFLDYMNQNIVKECVKKNKKAVYDLMASHGDKENLIHFTLVMKDFDEVIENSIASGQYSSALTTLQQQKDRALYTRFIPVLLDKVPTATIDVLIAAGPILSPIKLLPKFSSKLDSETAREITRYLEHCTNSLRLTDQPIHDYLLSLYVQYYPVEKLMEYLEQQGNDVDRIRYDAKYALMMCLEKKLHIPTIHLYTIMGLYEEAVSLAIKIDLELAKKTADVPENDEELRKKLWLRIAKHVVKEKNDIQQAMEFLQQCDLLKIEDILPFFPNFVTIDHFKDAICSSLQDYNRHIHDLKEEMEEATKSAEVIREEIQAVRNRCAIVRANDRCTLCEVPLLIKNFYVFPCGHQFHADCLMGEVIPQLSQPRKALLADLKKKMQDVSLRHDGMSTGSAVISARDQIKSDIDDIVASECIYCGDNMIKLIDVPFIPDDEYDRVQQEWE